MKVPFHRPSIGEEEIESVVSTLRSGWLTSGPQAKLFEAEFERYVGGGYALAVNSGTAAMHLALLGLGIGPGDEVITSPLTFCATVNVISHVGATPVLADVGPDGNISPDSIAARISPRTRAIMPVHLAGLPCRMDRIHAIARERGLYVIEDAAHACSAAYGGRKVGFCDSASPSSDAVAFSFYATKNLTTGEGGMVITRSEELRRKMALYRLHGITRDAWARSGLGSWSYSAEVPGFKYNLSDLQAAIGLEQLRKQKRFREQREACAQRYNAAFSQIPELQTPPDDPSCRHAWHLYVLRLNLDRLDVDRDRFIERLAEIGVGASVHFIPIPRHPIFREHAHKAENQCPLAGEWFERAVSLPIFPSITEAEVDHVIRSVTTLVHQHSERAVAVGMA